MRNQRPVAVDVDDTNPADAINVSRVAPWRFKAVVEGDLVHIVATFDASGVEAFRAKLVALRAVLDAPTSAIEARSDATGTGAAGGESAPAESRDAQPQPKDSTNG